MGVRADEHCREEGRAQEQVGREDGTEDEVCRARECREPLRTISLYAWAGAAVCRVRGKGKHGGSRPADGIVGEQVGWVTENPLVCCDRGPGGARAVLL